jgi:hypothetical protein
MGARKKEESAPYNRQESYTEFFPLPSAASLLVTKNVYGIFPFQKARSAFLGSLGIKTAKHRLAFAAPAFGALILLLLPLLHREGNRVFFFAILTLELVVWHICSPFSFFLSTIRSKNLAGLESRI